MCFTDQDHVSCTTRVKIKLAFLITGQNWNMQVLFRIQICINTLVTLNVSKHPLKIATKHWDAN